MPTYYGTNYSESISGSIYADIIYGYGGHDLLSGGRGDDAIFGGTGDDDIVGGTGANDLWGGAGADRFFMSARGSAGPSDDAVVDFELDEDDISVSAWGVSDFSQIEALLESDAAGDATLNAFYFGYDHVLTLEGIDADELVSSDFVYNNSGARRQTGTGEDDVLFGSRFDDVINGSGGDDIVLGGIGNDRLAGGSGDDDIIGGAGRDFMAGGAGEDAFVFNAASETRSGLNRDRIEDFWAGVDFIDLENIDARTFQAGDQDFVFRDTGAFTGAGQIRYSYSGGSTIISGNTDSNVSTIEFQIELSGRYNLDAGDFDL